MNAHALLEQAKQAKEKLKDQSQESSGGFTREPAAPGVCVGRLVSYVELGKQEPRNKGKFYKGPKPTALVQFELLGKKHAREIEVDGVKKITYPIQTEELSISSSAKSLFFQLMQSLDYGRGNTHMAFMLTEGFKFKVTHTERGEGADKQVYANIRGEQGWNVGAPVKEVEDDDGELVTKPVKVPEATVQARLFLWDAPTKEQWDSLFIDGTHTRKIDGKEVEVSNNWLQRRILEAEDFEGSPIQALLQSLDGGLPNMGSTDPGDADDGDALDDEGSSDELDDDSDPLAGLDMED